MKRWYVIQVFSGYEEVIKKDLHARIQEAELQDLFGEVLIPSAKVKQMFSAEQESESKQLFPGYMLVEMQAEPQAIRLVNTTPRVMRFLGGKDPVALSSEEIDRVLGQVRGDVAVSLEKHEFEVGGEVEIEGGPFAGFVGIIESIDEEGEKLTVMVSIFGRMTPVEIGFDQVKR